MVLHSQVTFSRSKMSSEEEGDYVDMSVIFRYISNKDILLLLTNDFICVICCFSWVIIFLVGKLSFILCFRTTDHKETNPQPSTSGTIKENKCLKTLFLLCFPVINFKWIILFLAIR